jgi:hypothetical protein
VERIVAEMEKACTCLARTTHAPHIHRMPRPRRKSPLLRVLLLITGVLLIAATPLVGIIPGPGGIFVFAAGLVLVLQNSKWARRRFARLKKRWPRFGHYSDMALRRRSFRKRQQRAKELALAQAADQR